MSHDVFISHARTDAIVATAACRSLEAHGIGCWIAPRDIATGQPWSAAIVDAIGLCRVFMVALSAGANGSREVAREVELASQRRKPTLVWRIEDVRPAGALEYFLAPTQWQDGFHGPLGARLQRLVASASGLLRLPVPLPPPSVPAPRLVEVELDDFDAPSGTVGGLVRRLLKDR